MAKFKLIKHAGPQACDACGREFVARKGAWVCPHCGFDNVAGQEFGKQFQQICTERSAKRAAERAAERQRCRLDPGSRSEYDI